MTEKKEMESFSEKDTFLIGKQFGTQAKAGDIYLLHGDLGVGKTVFTKGFAEGLGIEEPITSPTFTLIQEYMEGRLPFYHFDVYRIGDVEEMYDIGIDEYLSGDGVCLIEWPSGLRKSCRIPAKIFGLKRILKKDSTSHLTCDKEGDRES